MLSAVVQVTSGTISSMQTPDAGNPTITEYYYGGAVSGWNAGIWDERPSNIGSVTFPELHNFAPILISDFDAGTPLTFNLCGNGYFYGPPSGAILYADVLIARCSQFFNPPGGTAAGVDYQQVFNGSASTNVSGAGTICFDFSNTFSITGPCEFHAAVALVIVSDQVGTSKLDFSYQLRANQ